MSELRISHPLNRAPSDARSSRAADVRQAFTQFVGNTFYSQMMKAMRDTQGQPAYFHGGRAEEVFQSQLDQQLVDHLTVATAEKFAGPMFRQQFPALAATEKPAGTTLDGLSRLPRR